MKPMQHMPDGTGPASVEIMQWTPSRPFDQPVPWTSTIMSGALAKASRVVIATCWRNQSTLTWARLLVAAVAEVLRAPRAPKKILAMKASQPRIDLDTALDKLGRLVAAWRQDIHTRPEGDDDD